MASHVRVPLGLTEDWGSGHRHRRACVAPRSARSRHQRPCVFSLGREMNVS